ncbi:MAG: Gfo/Idh/MocA family oxidoreductase [Planctomycetes bacterium]|nr:Gfo/Idh/MocA family oxidoreductase [Planctomycetota bacterium]
MKRRDFLKAGVGAVSFPYLIPSAAMGKAGTVAPSNRIVMGAIGTGSMGTGDLRGFLGKKEVQFVAVCDVDSVHMANAKKHVDDKYGNTDCREYGDYRDLVARGDLDAVIHALPDHWHGIVSVACARAGLDIHGQKPLARTIKGGRAICDAVKRYGRVWQTGSWQRSVGTFHKAAELVNAGVIGKVKYCEVGLPNGFGSGVLPVTPVPERLNYDMWLGPAPWREHVAFNGDTVHWNWRWVMDYSGGQLTDWAGHHIDIAHWGLGFDGTGPVSITEAKGVYPTEGTYDVPTAYRFKNTYANGVEMVVANASQQPHGMGACWYGENGQWIHVRRGGMKASSPEILKTVLGPNDKRLYKSTDHKQNFLDCIKSRKKTITPVETAHRSISAGLLGEIAMLTGRDLKWDPVKETFIGDEAANRYLSRPFRAPWHY